ncbi:MAG TPA: response regulator [Marmoricola sp.]|nr:response regulator [Marmoricola sp.]
MGTTPGSEPGPTETVAGLRAQLADLQARTDNAEHLAGMGSYDWHIPTDTNSWSDELYRIYGHEPQSFNPSYERFIALIHPEDRERISALHQRAYSTGEPYQMIERIVRPDGEVRYLSSNGQVIKDEDGTPVRMRGTCVDITERVLAERAREEAAERLGEASALRRAAMELNDNVVQGLAAAVLSLETGDQAAGLSYVRRTMGAARSMMERLLEPSGRDGLRPGDLVRAEAARLRPVAEVGAAVGAAVVAEVGASPPSTDGTSTATSSAASHQGAVRGGGHRVLLVDDAEDLRDVLRLKLERHQGYEVVGEAGDGAEGIELARRLQPDLVLLDLAMPRMDGLEALPLIREAAPAAQVVVLSGFNENTMAQRALAAGARDYVVKGGSLKELVATLDGLVG